MPSGRTKILIISENTVNSHSKLTIFRLWTVSSWQLFWTQWSTSCISQRQFLSKRSTIPILPRIGVYTTDTYPKNLIHRVFVPSNNGSLPSTERTIAHFLSSKGCHSKLIGKWHLGHHDALPTQRGFTSFFGLPYSHEEGFPGPGTLSTEWYVHRSISSFFDRKLTENNNLYFSLDFDWKHCFLISDRNLTENAP